MAYVISLIFNIICTSINRYYSGKRENRFQNNNFITKNPPLKIVYIDYYMKKFSTFIIAWAPPLAWMIIIFYFSTRHRLQASSIFTINFIVFKSLHVIEYAILYLLLFRSFFLSNKRKITNDVFIFAAIVAILYAASDEFHQTFVPTREGKPRDVFIDAIGISIMYGYLKLHTRQIKKLFK